MRIAVYIIGISIANYLIITMIVDICLMGRVSFSYAPKVWEKRIIISKKNRIDIQAEYQCSAYAAAYILRNYGIPAVGKELYPIIRGKMKSGYVYPKGLKDLLRSYGFEVTYCRGNMNALKYEIRNGNPVIVMILVKKDKDWLHYVPVVGYDEHYVYFAESLESLINCNEKYYNRKVENVEFKKLWNTSMLRQPFYKNTYFRIRKQG